VEASGKEGGFFIAHTTEHNHHKTALPLEGTMSPASILPRIQVVEHRTRQSTDSDCPRSTFEMVAILSGLGL